MITTKPDVRQGIQVGAAIGFQNSLLGTPVGQRRTLSAMLAVVPARMENHAPP